MRVLNVTGALDTLYGGGVGERTLQMSRSLTKAGAKCTILTLDMGVSSEFKNVLVGVEIFMLPLWCKRFKIPFFSIKKIKNIVKHADIIHLVSHWTLINALVYIFARLMNKPYVVCPAGSLRILGRSKLLKRFYNLVIGKKIICNASSCIAITADEIHQFQTYGVDAIKVLVIPNGINKEDYFLKDDISFHDKYGLGNNPFILFVGRLNPIKGPDLLLAAFCQLKDKLSNYHLVFVGNDEGLLSTLKRTVEETGIEDRVHFIGHVEKKTISTAHNTAALLVIPSRHEAMSIVVLEAGITSTPVLITDQCGFNEIDRIGGGMVVPASVDGLRKGLIEMLNSKARLKTMGQNLYKHIEENFTWDSIIHKYIHLYNQILNRAQ